MHVNAKKILMILTAIVLTPIVVFIVLTLLLYVPPVQNWVADRVADYASEQTGDSITVGRVGLSFPLDLQLSDFSMLQKNDSLPNVTDTICDVKSLVTSVQLIPLFKGQVNVDELTFKGLKLNTDGLIGDLRIKGNLDKLHVHSHGINLKGDSANVDFAEIGKGWIDIALGDTMPKDTSSKTLWKIKIGKVSLSQTAFGLHLPGDTMSVNADFHMAVANNVDLLLHDNIYNVEAMDWHGGSLSYDMNYEPRAKRGFDSNHLAFSDVNLGVDSFSYSKEALSLMVRAANFKEHSGLRLDGLAAHFLMNDRQIRLSDLHVKMPMTDISGKFWMDKDAFADTNPGKFFANVKGKIGVSDLNPFLYSVDKKYLSVLPQESINLKGRVYGNMKYLDFRNLMVSYPSAFTVWGNGYVTNLMDTKHLTLSTRMKLKTRNMRFLSKFMPPSTAKMLRIPSGITASGFVKVMPSRYEALITALYGKGSMKLRGFYDTRKEQYLVDADANGFNVKGFLPTQHIGVISGKVYAKGVGTDFLAGKAKADADVNIRKFRYQNYILDNVKGNVRMSNGNVVAYVNSRNGMLNGYSRVRGKVRKGLIDVNLTGNIASANMRTLGFVNKNWLLTVRPSLNIKSDLKNYYHANGYLHNVSLRQTRRRNTSVLLAGDVKVNGGLRGKLLSGHVAGEIDKADLKALGVVDKPYVLSTVADLDVSSDLKKHHSVDGTISELSLIERHNGLNIRLLNGNADINAKLSGNNVQGNISGNVGYADLYQLGVTDKPFTTSLRTALAFKSDLDEFYYADGYVDDLLVNDGTGEYAPGRMNIGVNMSKASTHVDIAGGDFKLLADAGGSYKMVLKSVDKIIKEVTSQITNKRIDQPAIMALLPNAHLVLNSGGDNILASILAKNGYKFKNADIDLCSSAVNGLNGTVAMDSLVYNDSITVDELNVALKTEDNKLKYDVALLNNVDNAYPYKGTINGTFFEKGIIANATIRDSKDKKALDMGLQAAMHGDGIMLSVISPHSIIGYKDFAVNDSNYVYIGHDKRVSADMRLLAKDGAAAQIYTDDEDTTSLQNITLSMNNFELGKLLTVLPFAPNISGVLNGDYHVVQTAKDLTVSSDMSVQNMTYEDCPMGNVGVNMVYMPQEDGTHYVDAIISQNDLDVGQLTGTYDSKGNGNLDANMSLDKFPLSFINGFVPDKIIGLSGYGMGNVTIKGPLNNLDINGKLNLDSSYIFSEPYGIQMRFADEPVTIDNSKLLFDDFEMFANNSQPLRINGYLDFRNPNNMYLDTRMMAENFEIIDAKENPRSTIYGKAFVNFVGGMRGYLDNLRMGGRLDLLGNTDMTYVMRDTPLSTDDGTDGLVKFTNFNDSTPDVVVRPSIRGFQMDLSLGIDEQAHVVCALNTEHTNYIDLIGGGDLTLHYDPTNDMTLNGRYTLNSGQMKYSLDMIPLRTFNIQEGSYIEFTGEPTNPTLSITATEDVKANYSSPGGSDRMVTFNTGVQLTNTLSKPTVEFIVTAPDDTEAQSELNTKSAEERGKIAVTLLASGMYISDGKGGNYAMSSTLANFLQNQINSVTGRALNTMGLDISANMESTTDSHGGLHTDYTFNFSKRLWNNRLRISMGGRVSTGADNSNENGAYFDNFSLEYRLNQNETQYLKLYYDRQAYDWLEGDISEFGAGFMWRRKLQHFKDIFRFKSKKEEMPAFNERRDTLIRFKTNENK